jgi:hypothetical protein
MFESFVLLTIFIEYLVLSHKILTVSTSQSISVFQAKLNAKY